MSGLLKSIEYMHLQQASTTKCTEQQEQSTNLQTFYKHILA